jgi:hypothetical protein
MRLQLLVSLQRTLSNLMHTISVTPSPTRNLQISSMLLTSPSWKVLSTIPSSGLMPLKKVRRRNTKRNKRNLRLLRSRFFFFGFGFVTYVCFSLALSCKNFTALRVVHLGVSLVPVVSLVVPLEVQPAVSLVETRMVPAWRRSIKK